MKTDQIREKFLKFFEGKEHKIIESDSLVPKDDPTVLFTTAGMQQFKRQFLGHITDFTRAATSQKCLRTDDLDEVGVTDFHHTFFEMLGNFSFGDYFKKDAIAWSWEFLTKELNIPEEKLWVSVYKDDKEAEEIWINDIGLDKSKIVALDDKSNFWPANAKENGPNGPCGPCSEIFYDWGENKNCPSKKCDPDCDCGRFSEVWNLVFTQFERKEGGALESLPSKNIDTGMGLERLAAVLQGKKNNFEIDLFAPILKAIDQLGVELELKEKRIIADHMRAIVISIADGVIPSNVDRGYVIKKLIIDISDIVLQAGSDKPSIYSLVNSVVEAMGVGYPELKGKSEEISGIVENVEKSFIKVRRERIPQFKEAVEKHRDSADELGREMFVYRDTYGLTLSTMEALIADAGIDEKIIEKANQYFQECMNEQKELSRKTSKISADVFAGSAINLSEVDSQFVGYDQLSTSSKIVKIYLNDEEVESANEGDRVVIVLEQTPFYAEAGGQIGDIGTLESANGVVTVADTQKIDDKNIHVGTITKGGVKIGGAVKAQIDETRRMSIMRNHTATHLLQNALRNTLGSGVKQQGSLVAENRLRFDFTHPKAVTKNELQTIEEEVNKNISAGDKVAVDVLPIEEARKQGALSFFEEKYGDVVRVVSIGNYSKEFCGGTHLQSTDQIESFKIVKEGSVAQGIRRIEAITANYVASYENEIKTQMSQKEQAALAKKKAQEGEKEAFNAIRKSLEKKIEKSDKINDITIFCESYENINIGNLRKIADYVKQKTKSAVVALGSRDNDGASILVAATDDAISKGYNANEIIKQVAPIIDGSGGGRPQLAQAGSKNSDKLDDALNQVKQLIKEQK